MQARVELRYNEYERLRNNADGTITNLLIYCYYFVNFKRSPISKSAII